MLSDIEGMGPGWCMGETSPAVRRGFWRGDGIHGRIILVSEGVSKVLGVCGARKGDRRMEQAVSLRCLGGGLRRRVLALIAVLLLAFGLAAMAPAPAQAASFRDVPSGQWYTSWVDQASDRGLMSGFTDPATGRPTGCFGPDEPLKWHACLDTVLTFERKTPVLPRPRSYAARGSSLMPEKYHWAGVS